MSVSKYLLLLLALCAFLGAAGCVNDEQSNVDAADIQAAANVTAADIVENQIQKADEQAASTFYMVTAPDVPIAQNYSAGKDLLVNCTAFGGVPSDGVIVLMRITNNGTDDVHIACVGGYFSNGLDGYGVFKAGESSKRTLGPEETTVYAFRSGEDSLDDINVSSFQGLTYHFGVYAQNGDDPVELIWDGATSVPQMPQGESQDLSVTKYE